jgi:hypothetical protein
MTVPGAGRRHRLRTGIGTLALTAVALALPATVTASSEAEGSVSVSNERTLTRWAHPLERSPIRARPRAEARAIVSTHAKTEDGFPEVYLALRRWTDPEGHIWLKIRIPMRPNGNTGWVRDSALGPLYTVRTRLVVDRGSQRATLFKKGTKIWRAPVGVGKSSTPTPPGNFWIREKFKTSDAGGAYGPAAFGTSAYSVLSEWPGGGVIGIHGTNAPGLIPGAPSHGCIRVRNGSLLKLWKLLPIGTPVLIK